MKRKLLLLIPPIIIILVFLGYRFFMADSVDKDELVEVEKGRFEYYVVSMGELEAHESKDILIPDVLLGQTVRIRRIAINDLVREGTEVEKGDYVATLDPSEVEEQQKSTQETLDMLYANLENAKMDSSLNLTDARDAIRRSHDNVLDAEVKVEQSVYESKAVQRQAAIELEMARRQLEQKKRNYQQQKRKNELSLRRIEDNVRQEEQQMVTLQQLKQDLVIKAPSAGVVVYVREWDGEKKKVGDMVSRWDPRIAILPDLSTILSVTYVKEIDVNEIQEGMPVKITIDAFPGEEFSGIVRTVANIGQEIEGQFLNGFKVEIEVDPNGFDLLPGMTSTNRFIIQAIDDQLMVPRDVVFVENNEQIVYKKTPLGIVRQKIKIEGENEKMVRVTEGLSQGDKILEHPPQ
ncbi:efflux RND transporter periplasmic adaptor subunit [Marinilabilia salmonicolor]|uniref:efflux RND transporter periplasmic adaptor subunit n=1 Tax=Marinilabilia salmonicolor TaxID=989 RepID=UPI00029AC9E0|nr:efflux RND transporter periplasmic adaptor subunit [Marinilabilia salmonicolor]